MGTSTASLAKKAASIGLVWICLVVPAQCCGRGSIKIENNQYKQILIAIGHEVEENPVIIDKLKEIFTGASEWIYKLTHKRAYFGDITILVPDTWEDQVDYEQVGQESYDKSDVQIEAEDKRFGHGDRPFVLHTTGCGELGHYMHITPQFLLNSEESVKNFGPLDKVVAHEWGHFRYGVYDEYPEEDLETASYFYADKDGKIEATRCVLALTGKQLNIKTKRRCRIRKGLPEEDCRFIDDDDPDKFEPKYGSFMYKQFLSHVVEYCDNSFKIPHLNHNKEAPNPQNKNCEGKSIWEVLRNHPDFKDDANPPKFAASTVPTFKVVRQKIRRYILVMDMSGSMGPDFGNRIGKLQQGVTTFITNDVKDGEYVGMVMFNGTGYPVHDLILVNQTTRPQLVTSIPRMAVGATSIGGGIKAALDMLKRSDGGTAGASMIIISDGEENREPWISAVNNQVKGAGLTLHSIAITDEADTKVDELTVATGGMNFLYTNDDKSNALNEAFHSIGQIGLAPTQQSYPIESRADMLTSGAAMLGQVIVDNTLGKNSEFIFNYDGYGVDINLISPNGTVYNKSSEYYRCDTNFGVGTFQFPGQGEQGVWTYNVTNTVDWDQRVTITARSQAYENGGVPITAKVYWGKKIMALDLTKEITKQALYVAVSKGYVPVLYAEVIAVVDRPDKKPQRVTLLDNGAGADTTKRDGIYSGYFLGFVQKGRYNVKVSVQSTNDTVLSPSHLIGIGAPRWSKRKRKKKKQKALADISIVGLQRNSQGGSFELSSLVLYENQLDSSVGQLVDAGNFKLYPPDRIKDLQMKSADPITRQITLIWTAVGDQLDLGQATSYDLRYSHNFDLLNEHFHQQKQVTEVMVVSGGNLTSPKPAGLNEEFVIQVPELEAVSYVFAVQAVDEDGRSARGPMSNIVSATLKIFPDDESEEFTQILWIIFGVLGNLALISIAVVAYIIFFRKRGQKKDVEQKGDQDVEQKGENRGVDNYAFNDLKNKYGAMK